MVTPLIPFRAVIHLRQVHMGLYSAILLIKTESNAMSPFGLNFSYRYQSIRRTKQVGTVTSSI